MLVVSRDPSGLAPLWAVGEAGAWQLESASSGWEALERVQSDRAPELVVLDLARGDSDGLHTLHWLRRVCPDLPILVICYPEDAGRKTEAIRLGAQDYLIRPLEEGKLETAIRRHLSFRSEPDAIEIGGEEVESLGDQLYFVAASRAMRKLRAQAQLLAQLNVPLLILGESGSGKETVARFIHRLSVRSAFRFLKVNCAALPGDLLENELFGYDRALAAAMPRPKVGKFELCDRGTILLEEFTDMPLNLQAKLLHVLQERQGLRPGGDPGSRPDVRIFACTNADIDQALADGRLREDLYYRLSGFSVQVPPLRQRRDEIPLLLGYFMNRLSRHYALTARSFSPAVLSACQFYSWPGNLTELESFVKRYLVAGDESQAIRELDRKADAMPTVNYLSMGAGVTLESLGNGTSTDHESSLKSLVQSVKGETERNAIATALETTRWNRKAAARLLRVSYRTLLYKIQQYHMTPPPGYLSPPANGNGIKGNGGHH